MRIAPGDLIAVTGATGAIGRLIVPDLLEQGFRIRSLSRSAPSDSRAEHVPVDLASGGRLERRALDGCSAVLHLASFIPARQDDPASAETCLRTNALGTLKLLQATEDAGIDRFIQTTSANAYAPGLEAPSEEDPMYPSERAPFYLSSKLVQDILGAYWRNSRGLAATTLRLSSVYGAGMKGALFTRFATSLHGGEAIRLANGGIFGADFVEVSDVSGALTLFLQNGVTGSFNVASGVRTTLLQAAQLLLNIAGCGQDLLVVDPQLNPEPGFPRMDISKARECGFSPTDLRTGLARLVQWVSCQER